MSFNPNAAVWVPGKGLVTTAAEPAAKPAAASPAPSSPATPAAMATPPASAGAAAPASWEDSDTSESTTKSAGAAAGPPGIGAGAAAAPAKKKAATVEVSDSPMLEDAMMHAGTLSGAVADGDDEEDEPSPAPVRRDTDEPAKVIPVTRMDLSQIDEPVDDESARASVDTSTARKHVNIVFIGHVDAGKSTTSGHLLYLTGMISDRTLQAFEAKAKALHRESWVFAWALDTTESERAKGKTEEIGRAVFETANKRFTILDAPGHKNFIPHMIGGASQADVGVLVISARKGEFETGFEKGGQTREHAMLAKTAGVRQLIVAINKMDDPTVEWSKERYDECVDKLTPYLRQVGYNPKTDITWVPISGLKGYNLKEPLGSMCPWYTGLPLLTILDELKPPKQLYDVPLRLPITDKYKSMGTVVLGKLESGSIREGERLMLMPNRVMVDVVTLTIENTDVPMGEPGDNLKIKIRGIEEEDVRVGFVLSDPVNVVPAVTRFDAQIIILEHKSIICAGYSAILHIHACVEDVIIEELLATIDKKTNKVIKKKPRFVSPGMTVKVRLVVPEPICIEPFKTFQQLGRFMLRDEGKTVAVGVVTKLRGVKGESAAAEGDHDE